VHRGCLLEVFSDGSQIIDGSQMDEPGMYNRDFKKRAFDINQKVARFTKSGEQNLIIFREYLAEISEKIDRAHKGSGT